MKYPSKELIEMLRKEYPVGTKVRLVRMDDKFAPPVGTIGEVTHIDDVGTIHTKWSNGSSLGIAYGVDYAEKI